MHKRFPFIVFLVVLCIVSAPAALPQVKGAFEWHDYDATNNKVTMHIRNTSSKDITAYNITTRETLPDHSVSKGERLTDMLSAVFLVQQVTGTPDEDRIRGKFGNGTLAAGQTRDEVFDGGAVVNDFDATIDVVAYADGTAEATNAPALERLREHRNAEIRSYQKATETIREVLADSTIQNPAEEAAARLRKFLTVWSAQPHYSVDIERGTIEAVIRDLNLVAGRHLSGEPEFLQQYVAEKDQYTSFVSKHVELKGAAQ